MKLGIAIAANRPIMATTIMISTSVKPPLRDVLVFMFGFSLLRREHSNKRVIIISFSVHVLLVANRIGKSNSSMAEINTQHQIFLSDLDPTASPYCSGRASRGYYCPSDSGAVGRPASRDPQAGAAAIKTLVTNLV